MLHGLKHVCKLAFRWHGFRGSQTIYPLRSAGNHQFPCLNGFHQAWAKKPDITQSSHPYHGPPRSLLQKSAGFHFNIELNTHPSRNNNDLATHRVLCVGHLGHYRGTFQSLWWQHLATGLASVVKEIPGASISTTTMDLGFKRPSCELAQGLHFTIVVYMGVSENKGYRIWGSL